MKSNRLSKESNSIQQNVYIHVYNMYFNTYFRNHFFITFINLLSSFSEILFILTYTEKIG